MAKNELALIKKDVVDVVSGKVMEFQKTGELSFPHNYSPENAMKAAWLKLQEITDKTGAPVLQSCTKDSIANALLTMAVYGLTPIKDQGYFIAYGNRLVWQNSYFGNVALWKRVTGSDIDPEAVIVYAGDDFEYDIIGGEYHVTKHKQSLSNINDSKIAAAYAILTYANGSQKTTLMTFDQIKKAWAQGTAYSGGKSTAHNNFPAEMAKKTVINRACKVAIKASDDSSLDLVKQTIKENEGEISEAIVEAEISENANQELIDVEAEYTVIATEPEPETPATDGSDPY